MSLLKPGNQCVASEIIVTVTQDGKPVADATVERKVDWTGVGEKSDSTQTDDTGRFHLPAVYMRSVRHGVLPEEMVATTQISVHVDGEPQEIILAVKRYHEAGAEFGGHSQMQCALENDTRLERFGASLLETRCTWEEEN